jgi:hypothetical protein
MVYESLKLLKAMKSDYAKVNQEKPEEEASREILRISTGGGARYQVSNAANRGKTKEEIQEQITRREAYLSKKHMLRDEVVHTILAPAGGLGLKLLTGTYKFFKNNGMRGSSSFETGIPWRDTFVGSTVTENPTTITTYQPLPLLGNAVVWTIVAETVGYASLRLYDKYLSWQLGKELEKLEELEKKSK